MDKWQLWRETALVAVFVVLMVGVSMCSKSPVSGQSTATFTAAPSNTPFSAATFAPTAVPSLPMSTALPQCPALSLDDVNSNKDWDDLDPQWMVACSHCLPDNLMQPTTVYQLITPTWLPSSAPDYDLNECFVLDVDEPDDVDMGFVVPYEFFEGFPNKFYEAQSYEGDLIGFAMDIDIVNGDECTVETIENDVVNRAYVPEWWFGGAWNFGLGYEDICFEGVTGACDYFGFSHAGAIGEITFNIVQRGLWHVYAFGLAPTGLGDGNCDGNDLATITIGFQEIYCPIGVPTPVPTFTPAPTNTPGPTDTPQAAGFYVDYTLPATTGVHDLCTKGAPNDWYVCGDTTLITNTGDPIVGYVYTGTVSQGSTGAIVLGGLIGGVGGSTWDGSLSMSFPIAINSGETRSICAASAFYGLNGAPSLDFDVVCDQLGFTTGAGWEQASAGAGYSIENGSQVRFGYRIGWAGGTGTGQLSNVGAIRYGVPSGSTPAPQATNTPAPTWTPQATPTFSGVGGYCSNYVFRNDEPIVTNIDPQDYITAVEGDCFTILPAVDFDDMPFGIGQISWPAVKLCPDYYSFPSITVAGVTLGLELLLLLPFLLVVRRVGSL